RIEGLAAMSLVEQESGSLGLVEPLAPGILGEGWSQIEPHGDVALIPGHALYIENLNLQPQIPLYTGSGGRGGGGGGAAPAHVNALPDYLIDEPRLEYQFQIAIDPRILVTRNPSLSPRVSAASDDAGNRFAVGSMGCNPRDHVWMLSIHLPLPEKLGT